ncbi:hypothetical protein V2J09_011470 [Rumex salicifolius]
MAFLEKVEEDFNKRYGGGKAATTPPKSLNKEFGRKSSNDRMRFEELAESEAARIGDVPQDLKKHMACRGGCLSSIGSDQPAEVVDDAPRHLVLRNIIYTIFLSWLHIYNLQSNFNTPYDS